MAEENKNCKFSKMNKLIFISLKATRGNKIYTFSLVFFVNVLTLTGFSENVEVDPPGFPVKFKLTPWKSKFFPQFLGVLPWNSNDFYSTP